MENLYLLGKTILNKLEDNGYEAYFVGGFVRDYLLGKESSDIDITTNAKPNEVEELFDNTKATGLKYGTITVLIDNHPFEVTTYRIDQKYINHRKPESVIYSKRLEEDLKRRDFTINALAMDKEERIIDLFNGREDLNQKIIRAIGNPDERFNEDALRIIRALRFAAKLGFSIDEETLISMKKNIEKIVLLPNERIIPELEELFLSPFNKIATVYMEEINFANIYPEFKEGLTAYNNSEISLHLNEFFVLSLYLSNQELPNYWRLPNKDKLLIYKVIGILKLISKTHYNPLIVYQAGIENCLMANKIIAVLNSENDQEAIIQDIYDNLPIKKRNELKFNGHDILDIKEIDNEEIIGEIIEEIEYNVVNKHIENEREKLKDFAKKLLERIDG